MALKFQNNGFATLSAGITSGATSIALTAGQGANFPTFAAGDYMWATLIAALTGNVEVVLVTARATDTLTVLRGMDGTTAQAFLAGDRIESRLSNGSLRSLQQEAASAVATSGTDTYTATLSPAPQGLNTDQVYFVKFGNANTIINPTLNLNGLGAKTIVSAAGAALSVGALQASAITVLHYDGAQFRLLNGTASAGNMVVNDFTGDGSTVAFTLTADPGTANNTWVCVGGVYQQKNTYSVVGTTLTFTTAPPLTTTGNIEVVIGSALAIGTPSDNTVTTAKLVDSSVTYAKIQNVTATSRILGRATAGAGVVEELPASSAMGILVAGWSMTVLTASNAAWAVPAGTKELIIEAWGAGGSGAGGDNVGNIRGQGGSGGAYLLKRVTSNFDSTLAITIGAGGAAVAAASGGTNGNNGTATTVVGTNLGTLSAGGGLGGTKGSAGSGQAGGTATGGDINLSGGGTTTSPGSQGLATVGVGVGGDSPHGGFGAKENVATNGYAPGGGGSCGNHTGGSSGAGAIGRVVIWQR